MAPPESLQAGHLNKLASNRVAIGLATEIRNSLASTKSIGPGLDGSDASFGLAGSAARPIHHSNQRRAK
jgi:hypothetical protein